MKKLIFPVLSILVLAGCKKDGSILTGTWRLTAVYDKADTGMVSVPKPAGETGDILLIFGSRKSYSGKTFERTYTNGSYTLTDNRIDFGISGFSGEPDDDEWSLAFTVMLTSCRLQSVYPCIPDIISISNDQLIINTAMRYDLVFERTL